MGIKVEEDRKPGSVPPGRPGGDDHSSGAGVTDRLVRPNPEAFRRATCLPPRPTALRRIRRGTPPYLVLLRVSPPGLVRSYRTVSPLPGTVHTHQSFHERPWRFVFCGTFLRVAPTGSYPAPCSAEPGLSSPRLAAGSDHLAFFNLTNTAVSHTTRACIPALECVGDKASQQSASRGLTVQDRGSEQMNCGPTKVTRLFVPPRSVRAVHRAKAVGLQGRAKALAKRHGRRVVRGPPRSN